MTWEDAVIRGLHDSGIEFVAYLPDSILDHLIDRTIEDTAFQTVRVVREEHGVAMLGGAWLGGTRSALICQSSGLANCFNALGSHSVPANLPFLALVTRRGDLGEFNRSQVPAGYGLPGMLDAVGVRYHHLDKPHDSSGDLAERVRLAAHTAFATQQPYVLLLERPLTGGKND